jgi:AbrB family looped-hinge helix DNA binding protein
VPRATLTSKGQITIPRAIRQALNVGAGDRLDFVLESEGRVLVQAAVREVGELMGLLRRARRKTRDRSDSARGSGGPRSPTWEWGRLPGS